MRFHAVLRVYTVHRRMQIGDMEIFAFWRCVRMKLEYLKPRLKELLCVPCILFIYSHTNTQLLARIHSHRHTITITTVIGLICFTVSPHYINMCVALQYKTVLMKEVLRFT